MYLVLTAVNNETDINFGQGQFFTLLSSCIILLLPIKLYFKFDSRKHIALRILKRYLHPSINTFFLVLSLKNGFAMLKNTGNSLGAEIDMNTDIKNQY